MANKMQTINIKGKDYVPVNERLKAFRSEKIYEGWTLQTVLHELTPDYCTMEARVTDKDGRLVANGFARECRQQAGSMVNATSYVENCETSAWGRALGNLGIGIDSSICSAQELLLALNQQQTPQKPQISTQGASKSAVGTITQPRGENVADAKFAKNKGEDYALLLDAIVQDINAADSVETLKAIVDRYKGTAYYDDVRVAANAKYVELKLK